MDLCHLWIILRRQGKDFLFMADRPLNIVYFGVDSLRADRLSCYGYPRLTSPHIDQLAARGVLFENSFSAYIPTTPGSSSMLTGRDVVATGMVSLGTTRA